MTRPHGTYLTYRTGGCRCRPCTDAVRDYERARRRRHAYGDPPLVDATPATQHIETLRAAGLGLRTIAARAGISRSALSALLHGRPERGYGPTGKARPETVAAILAIPHPRLDDLPDGLPVPALGATRRLRALTAAGWTLPQIATHARLDDLQAVRGLLNGGSDQATAATVRTIRDTYAALELQAPPETTPHERAAATRARNRATREGWPGPAWWDADTIDQPDHEPDTTPAEATTWDRLDDWTELVNVGVDPEVAARRCGWIRLNSAVTAAQRVDHQHALAAYQAARDLAAA